LTSHRLGRQGQKTKGEKTCNHIFNFHFNALSKLFSSRSCNSGAIDHLK
jgi:hypothetical protein